MPTISCRSAGWLTLLGRLAKNPALTWRLTSHEITLKIPRSPIRSNGVSVKFPALSDPVYVRRWRTTTQTVFTSEMVFRIWLYLGWLSYGSMLSLFVQVLKLEMLNLRLIRDDATGIYSTAIVWSISKTLILYCIKTLFTYIHSKLFTFHEEKERMNRFRSPINYYNALKYKPRVFELQSESHGTYHVVFYFTKLCA